MKDESGWKKEKGIDLYSTTVKTNLLFDPFQRVHGIKGEMWGLRPFHTYLKELQDYECNDWSENVINPPSVRNIGYENKVN